MIEQAIKIHRAGGDDAVREWYCALSPEQQKQYRNEISGTMIILKRATQPTLSEIADSMAVFAKELNAWFEGLTPEQRMYLNNLN